MIIGACVGLGASIAGRFAACGDQLYLIARRKSLLEDFQADLLSVGATSVEYRLVDLADRSQTQQPAEDLPKRGIDVLINDAGFGQLDFTEDTLPERIRAMIDVNALALLSLAFSQLKREEPARLMNVASGAGYALFEGSIPYCASKFFVIAFTEGIAQQLSSQELPMRPQLLAPGPLATEFMSNAMKEQRYLE